MSILPTNASSLCFRRCKESSAARTECVLTASFYFFVCLFVCLFSVFVWGSGGGEVRGIGSAVCSFGSSILLLEFFLLMSNCVVK